MARTSGLRRLWPFGSFDSRLVFSASRLSRGCLMREKKKNPREQGIVMLSSRDTSEKSSESNHAFYESLICWRVHWIAWRYEAIENKSNSVLKNCCEYRPNIHSDIVQLFVEILFAGEVGERTQNCCTLRPSFADKFIDYSSRIINLCCPTRKNIQMLHAKTSNETYVIKRSQ